MKTSTSSPTTRLEGPIELPQLTEYLDTYCPKWTEWEPIRALNVEDLLDRLNRFKTHLTIEKDELRLRAETVRIEFKESDGRRVLTEDRHVGDVTHSRNQIERPLLKDESFDQAARRVCTEIIGYPELIPTRIDTKPKPGYGLWVNEWIGINNWCDAVQFECTIDTESVVNHAFSEICGDEMGVCATFVWKFVIEYV